MSYGLDSLNLNNFNWQKFGAVTSPVQSFSIMQPLFSSGIVQEDSGFGIPYNFDKIINDWDNQQALIQQWFFAILAKISSNPCINHKPAPKIESNIRPYDYSRYDNNAGKISRLDPKMQEKTMALLDYAKSKGLKVTITSGYRTQEEQEELQRTRPQFAAKKSLHCQGKAIDIGISGGSDDDYALLGKYAVDNLGMRWGGNFKSTPKERWHFDMGLNG